MNQNKTDTKVKNPREGTKEIMGTNFLKAIFDDRVNATVSDNHHICTVVVTASVYKKNNYLIKKESIIGGKREYEE